MDKQNYKLEIHSLEIVNERISFYTDKMESTKNPNVNLRLLQFWKNYKLKNYPDEKTDS